MDSSSTDRPSWVHHPPAQAGTAPFSELHVVVYGSPRPDASQVLVATATALPLRGTVKYVPLMAGSTRWLTGVAAIHPLVGSVASAAPWIALAAGLRGSILVFLLLEAAAYRRDSAVQAFESEHRFAEALQRRLLPTLPPFAGLEVASSYLAGADDQQVGGDWFDVFELPSGQVAVAIGDVMGHDVDAAATMAQVRAALRSYAVEGGDPARTVTQLARFVELFGVSAVVTVIYGLLDHPGPDGSHRFRWANAGHLPPLLRHSGGQVEELAEPSSPLLGAPSTEPRPMGDRWLGLNSTLLLYTDGLVEAEGQDLAANVRQLQAVLGRAGLPAVQDVCATVLDAQLTSSRRDDVAILLVKVTELPATGEPTAETVRAAT
jgi:serine phosphatase RsbU (regulator of sigma subunit)